jgi:hypothetical protein
MTTFKFRITAGLSSLSAFKRWLSITLLCCVAVMGLAYSVALAESGCPPVDYGMTAAWSGRGSTVYFNINGFPANIRPQVEAAFNKWNAANQTNGTNIHFVPADATHPANFSVQVGPTTGVHHQDGSVTYNAAETLMRGNPTTGVVTSATTYVDLNNVRGTWYDQNQASFADAILKVMLHEIGHTMGLNDVPADVTQPCGNQTAGNSVMNGKCGINDQGNNLPTDVQPCDNQTAALVGQIAGPGGSCTDNDGDGMCAALDCDNDTVYDPTNCGEIGGGGCEGDPCCGDPCCGDPCCGDPTCGQECYTVCDTYCYPVCEVYDPYDPDYCYWWGEECYTDCYQECW